MALLHAADVFHLVKQTAHPAANPAGAEVILCIIWPFSNYQIRASHSLHCQVCLFQWKCVYFSVIKLED